MATDSPDPAEESHPGGTDSAGESEPRRGGGPAADNWLSELLKHPARAELPPAGIAPTEAAPRDTSDAPGAGCAGPFEPDPAFIGRYQVIRRLGQGTFGRVFLAHDADLQRQVAIKVPISHEGVALIDLELYLHEARVLARLSHPNIVPVHDVGHAGDGRGFVVSMYVSGGDLAARLKLGRPPFAESARLIAALCDAMHYAHTRDLFHRDIKPANILIDDFGVPYLADFGLALRDEDYGKGPRFAGTVAYTSPEQARGEGHLVDGRSDVFSIGVVFYEMLTGRRPFRGDTAEHVLRQITSIEPRPPRQIDDTIPRELERICLKAIAKRASERYATAGDMAEDAKHYLSTLSTDRGAEAIFTSSPRLPPVQAAEPALSSARAKAPSELAPRPIKVIPRGLGAFDEHDADFFLELLPGPRDRDGLPDGLRFWKTRIEATDAERTFRVGLIYGPSGCGKSSLLKAGLLPLLSPRVKPLYVESTAAETEAAVLRSLRRALPELPASLGLIDAMAFLRRDQTLLAGRKVLVVLDQFEQWLFARGSEPECELITALRQCDGERLQALCLVRDDFWMAATRFMRDLEIDMVPHRNVAAVDLFDLKHARRVLAAFGRAYEALPAEPASLTREQNAFLDQATPGLEQDGWVVPVRLALFAELVKTKPWTPATLREVGGTGGVGVRFLEETFGSARSNPNHRYHAQAAQAVLKSLLPENDSDIKGRMRSIPELRAACGYHDRPADFDHVLRVLDSDLRLITPVDPVDISGGESAQAERSYQLTHDYLVHSLREWLTRKQKSTRRGRAELLLAERAALWNAKPEGRHLPLVREWAAIRLLSTPAAWSEAERRMMQHADRKIARRGVAAAAVLAALLAAGFLVRRSDLQAHEKNHAKELVLRLQSAEIARVNGSIAAMSGYRRWTDPALRELLESSAGDPDRKLRASLALLSADPGQVEYLLQRLMDASPEELSVICELLRHEGASVGPRLWAMLESNTSNDPRVLCCAGALAYFDPQSPRWAEFAGKIARAMVSVNPIHVSEWLPIFKPVAEKLRAPLEAILRDDRRDETDHLHAMNYLVAFSSGSPERLVDLLQASSAKEFALPFAEIARLRDRSIPLLERAAHDDRELPSPDEAAKDHRAERRALAAVALFRLGDVGQVWPLLAHLSDPRLRSFVIHGLAQSGDPTETLRACLLRIANDRATQRQASARPPALEKPSIDPNRKSLFDPEASIRRAVILIAGHFDPTQLAAEESDRAIHRLLEIYRADPDPGVHGAARWALSRWRQNDQLRTIDSTIPQSKQADIRRWSVNSAGQTMVHIEGPLKFRMGVSGTDPEYQNEVEHPRMIPRRFAIAATEVSISEFDEFWKVHHTHFEKPQFGPGSDSHLPRAGVSWYMAAAYCNWLSQREGKQPVYTLNDGGEYAAGLRCDEAAFENGGYRLPTEAEWEYACRAGTETSRYYGHSLALLRKYARLTDWEKVSLLEAGSLLPNDFGLFDMLGNVTEWCHDADYDYNALANQLSSDHIHNKVISSRYCVIRGGSYRSRPPDAQSGVRAKYEPGVSEFTIGFRVARSLPAQARASDP